MTDKETFTTTSGKSFTVNRADDGEVIAIVFDNPIEGLSELDITEIYEYMMEDEDD